MRRLLTTFAVAGLLAAGGALAAPAVAYEDDDSQNDDWVCVGIIPPVDMSICPGSPYVLLPNPLVPHLPAV